MYASSHPPNAEAAEKSHVRLTFPPPVLTGSGSTGPPDDVSA